ncbi:MAG: type II toxin-antitoxin system Phd/YefM family antitoxin [Chloroflexota bacterium]|nr:type II toxin-antitoxin system Phd/YefM family antitoxin [Chloroflexota bacterium]
MRTATVKDAKDRFGRMIDLAPAEPIIVVRHGRSGVVAMSFEEFGRLKALEEEKARRIAPTLRKP